MSIKNRFKLRPATYLMLAATIAIIASLLVAPAFSASSNPCSPCHGTKYNQQLDVLEGNSQNQIPINLQVGHTQTVTVVIQNINNAARYNQLSSVSLTLSSQNGHFTVSNPTYTIATLPTGTATATWQITGVSDGSDALVISASAKNTHNNLQFTDSYYPNPTITVSAAPTPTPSPTQAPTPTPTPLPTASPTPTPIATPNPTPKTTATPTATPTPTSAPTSTAIPTATPSPNTSPNPTATQTPNPTSTNPSPTNTPQPIIPTPKSPTLTPTPAPTQNSTAQSNPAWQWFYQRLYLINYFHTIFRWFFPFGWYNW